MSGESPGATGFHRYHRGVPRMVTRSGLSLLVALVCVLGAGVAPVLADTLAQTVHRGVPPDGVPSATVRLETGDAQIALRQVGA